MKLSLITVATILCCSPIFSQDYSHSRRVSSSPTVNLTNLERYGIDYEVLNYYFQGDITILSQIDFTLLEQFRREDHQNKAYDPTTGLTILLYPALRRKNTNKNTTAPITTSEE